VDHTNPKWDEWVDLEIAVPDIPRFANIFIIMVQVCANEMRLYVSMNVEEAGEGSGRGLCRLGTSFVGRPRDRRPGHSQVIDLLVC
jgi:hypothetical protein